MSWLSNFGLPIHLPRKQGLKPNNKKIIINMEKPSYSPSKKTRIETQNRKNIHHTTPSSYSPSNKTRIETRINCWFLEQPINKFLLGNP